MRRSKWFSESDTASDAVPDPPQAATAALEYSPRPELDPILVSGPTDKAIRHREGQADETQGRSEWYGEP